MTHVMLCLLLLKQMLRGLLKSKLCPHSSIDSRVNRQVAGLVNRQAIGKDVFWRCWALSWSNGSQLAILLLLLLGEPCSGGMDMNIVLLLALFYARRLGVARLCRGCRALTRPSGWWKSRICFYGTITVSNGRHEGARDNRTWLQSLNSHAHSR